MNELNDVTAAFSELSIGGLVPLDIKDIPNMSWYKRLEMAIQLAVQLQALHDSGRVHCSISLDQVFINAQGQAVLGPSEDEAEECGRYKLDDVYTLGCVIYQLLFIEIPPWRTEHNSVKDVSVLVELLKEPELLSDAETAQFLTHWMCHPDPKERPSMGHYIA